MLNRCLDAYNMHKKAWIKLWNMFENEVDVFGKKE
jgi:hypothetical protein